MTKKRAIRILLGCSCGFAGVFGTLAARGEELRNAQGKGSDRPAAKTEPWKPEDFIYAESASQYEISPDGKKLVWVKSVGDKEKDGRVSNLFLSSLTEDREIQLTRGADSSSQPKWSPDGERIAFLLTRARPDGKPDNSKLQIWLINSRGGEPWPLTELSRSPHQIQWLDNETILYSAEEESSLYEEELKRKKDDSEVVEDAPHSPPVRLYKVGVKDRKVTRLTTNSDWIEGFAASRDGKFVVSAHARSLHYAFDQKTPPVLFLDDLAGGTEKQILAEGRIRPYRLEWAKDSSGVYVSTPYSSDPVYLTAGITLLYFYDVAAGKGQQVNLDWPSGMGFDFETVPDGIDVLLSAGSHEELAHFKAEKSASGWSWKRHPVSGDHARNLEGFTVSQDGRTIVYSTSTASTLPQLYRARLEEEKLDSPVQLSKLNPGLVSGRVSAKSELVRWKGSNQEEVEGILYYPANYQAGKRFPLVTAIHGGPMGADFDLWDESWAYPIQLFTDRGSFVLRPNYHGSSSYGLAFAESICCGNYYDLETPDINAGVDFLISKGFADPDRIGTMGWSNGSILSTSLITTYPERYKVASVGAGDVEWISDWANVDFGQSFDAYYFGKSPFEDPQLYIRKSPFFKMDKVQAPVLIFHGTADRNVPPAQSWSYYRALQHFGKTVKFVVFPGEPHGPRKLTHQLRKVEEEIAWFDRYFFQTSKAENESLKKDSLLADSLSRQRIQKSGSWYGVEAKPAGNPKAGGATRRAAGSGQVIPELVERGGLSISRFEVTRAQYAAFDKNYKFPAGTENYPASGIGFDQAKAYAAWLPREEGNPPFRLAFEDEVKELYQERAGENVLDYWAGYAPNREDTANLRKAAEGLSESGPLLREVGSFSGRSQQGEERIYDLGGNVAEWAVTRDGKGLILGGSADCPASPAAGCQAQPAYVGFRVVRGEVKPPPESK